MSCVSRHGDVVVGVGVGVDAMTERHPCDDHRRSGWTIHVDGGFDPCYFIDLLQKQKPRLFRDSLPMLYLFSISFYSLTSGL